VGKVLHVISDTNIGGAGKLLLVLLANINRDEFEVAVVLPKGSLLLPEIEKLGIKTIETEGIADKSFDFAAVKALREIFEEEKPDIVHTHAALSARIAARMAKLKVVHTRHSVHTSQSLLKEPAYKKHFPYKHIVGAINNYLSDVIIATSPVAKMSMMETGTKREKAQMVYNGIDGLRPISDEEKAAFRHKYGIGKDDFVCCMIARLEKVKGHEYMLRAAEMVQRETRFVKFIIAGTGSEEEAIRRLAGDLGLRNIIFAGFVQDVREVLGIADLQINSSHTETTCLALLEGLSMGVPAAASDSGGNPFVINDGINGVLFEERDYMALATAILKLRDDPEELGRLSRRAWEIFAERFESGVMTAKVEEIYRNLLAGLEATEDEDEKEEGADDV